MDENLVRGAGRIAFVDGDDRIACELRKEGIEPSEAEPEQEQLATARVIASVYGVELSVAADALAEARRRLHARFPASPGELFGEATHGG